MPRAIKKSVEKRDEADLDLRDTVDDIRERLGQRQRYLIYGLIAFLVVTVSVVGFFIYRSSTAEKAQDLAAEADRVLYGAQGTQPVAPAERNKKALDLYKESYATRKNAAVLLSIASTQYALGAYDDAVTSLKGLLDQFPDSPVVALSYVKMAMAYERKNDLNSALATLRNLLSIKNSSLQDLALLETGRLLELQGKADEAKASYRDLVSKFPQSPLVAHAKQRLGEKAEAAPAPKP